MAHMNQKMKKKLLPGIKKAFKDHGFKGSVAVENNTSLLITVSSGPIASWEREVKEDGFGATVVYTNPKDKIVWDSLYNALEKAANVGNFNASDVLTDYHRVGWFVDITVGKFDKPYTVI